MNYLILNRDFQMADWGAGGQRSEVRGQEDLSRPAVG